MRESLSPFKDDVPDRFEEKARMMRRYASDHPMRLFNSGMQNHETPGEGDDAVVFGPGLMEYLLTSAADLLWAIINAPISLTRAMIQ